MKPTMRWTSSARRWWRNLAESRRAAAGANNRLQEIEDRENHHRLWKFETARGRCGLFRRALVGRGIGSSGIRGVQRWVRRRDGSRLAWRERSRRENLRRKGGDY